MLCVCQDVAARAGVMLGCGVNVRMRVTVLGFSVFVRLVYPITSA